MKKIILYGVRQVELRRDIEYFLDGDYQIAGYSDSYYTRDVLDDKPFFSPKELHNCEFEYILPLSFQTGTLTKMRKILWKNGVPDEKIVLPLLFLHKNAEKCQLDLIGDLQASYRGETGLIFGLSYSLRGIHVEQLQKPFFDCTWHGLDLFYNYKVYEYMFKKGMTEKIRTALLVFPYYYFDYDMSRSLYQYEKGQIFSVWRLDDWHNYHKVPEARDYVVNYRLFGEKISQFYHFHRFELYSRAVYQGEDGMADLEHIWFCEHEETELENRNIFVEFIRKLREAGVVPVLIIPPFYLKGLTQKSRAAFESKRDRFYTILHELQDKTGEIQVLDCSESFEGNRESFMDLTHLNSKGAEEFTKMVNKAILA